MADSGHNGHPVFFFLLFLHLFYVGDEKGATGWRRHEAWKNTHTGALPRSDEKSAQAAAQKNRVRHREERKGRSVSPRRVRTEGAAVLHLQCCRLSYEHTRRPDVGATDPSTKLRARSRSSCALERCKKGACR